MKVESYKILIVEDSKTTSEYLEKSLKNIGHQIVGTASNGKDAIVKAKKFRPDLILMDIQLKGSMDGIKAAEIIKNHIDIAVVYLTAKSNNKTLKRAQISDPFAYILKPFKLEELEININIAVHKHRKLKENKEKFYSLYSFMSEGFALHQIIYADSGKAKDYLIIDINPAYESMFGLKKESAIGKKASQLFDTENPPYLDIYAEVAATGKARAFETYFQRLNKHFYISVFSPSQGKFATIISDITERKKNELKLKEQNEEIAILNEKYAATNQDLKENYNELEKVKEKAEESDRLKSAFLANMSHEIRTPMNGILGFAELLKDRDLSVEDKEEYTKIINELGNDLLQIINDILDISNIEANQVKIEIEECSVNTLFSELYMIFDSEKSKKNKTNIKIRINKAFEDKNSYIYADETRLRQVLSNLISNALKYTNEGQIEIGYQLINNNLRFYIKDTGIGIPKDKQKIIFERFRQADESRTRKHKGTGLGLAISKRLVELMGGEIWVESEGIENLNIFSADKQKTSRKGSVFYFTFPYQPVYQIAEIDDNKNNENTIFNWKNKKILIVEDDSASFQYLEAVMEETQVHIIHTTDGEKAVEICKVNQDIDLVLMDIQLPKMDGYEATRQIKKVRKNLPVITQTAYAMKEDRKMSIEAGCNDYISKPINLKTLMTTLDKYLRT